MVTGNPFKYFFKKKKYHKNLMNLLNQDLNNLIFIFNLFFWTINAALT